VHEKSHRYSIGENEAMPATYSVTVFVSLAGPRITVVEIAGENYGGEQYGEGTSFSATFYGVPNGSYTVTATYDDIVRTRLVTVHGSDTGTHIVIGG
jgi:hypothetical protein